MSWFVFALICLLGWGFADMFYKQSTDGSDRYSHLKLSVCVGLVMGICSFAFLPFSETVKHGTTVDFLKNALMYSPASLGYIISMVIGYAGLRYLELSVVSPVQNASGAFSAIAMTVFFLIFSSSPLDSVSDETGFAFSPSSGIEIFNNIIIVLGIILTVIGVVSLAFVEHRLSLTEKSDKKYISGALALLFPILYCVFDTVGTAADGILLSRESNSGLGEFDVLILYGFTFMLAGIAAWIFLLIKTKKPYNPFTKHESRKLIAAVCEEFGQVFYVYAMASKPVLAAPMIASYCIVSVLLSRICIKEKLTRSQYACVFSVIAGIVLLGISEGLGEI